jgi:hypothetical protein
VHRKYANAASTMAMMMPMGDMGSLLSKNRYFVMMPTSSGAHAPLDA